MKLRHYPTKRKLKEKIKKLEIDVRYFRNALETERTGKDLYLSELNQYKRENEQLLAVIAALTDKNSGNDKHSGFTCVGVTECPFD